MPVYGEFDGVHSDNAAVAGAGAAAGLPGGEHNLLREKTFNEELRHLVDKVTSHETSDRTAEDIDGISDDELVRRLHLLFYRSMHLENAGAVREQLQDVRLIEGRDEDSVINAIHEGLTALSFPAYSLLPFNLEKRCFTPAINTINSLDVYSLFIDIYDGLYAAIADGGRGILLSPKSIRDDAFLRKRFVAKSGVLEDYLYINSMRNIYRPLLIEFHGSGSVDPGFRMSPILIIRMKKSESSEGSAVLDERISRRLALAFLLYASEELKRVGKSGGDILVRHYRCLEYIYMAFSRMKGGTCFIFNFREYHHATGRYLYSYFESALRAGLSGSSFIQQLDKNRVAVFVSMNDAEWVKDTAARWRAAHGDIFSISLLDSGKGLNYIDFLNSYVFQ
ncbi:MAG TPA: hypothetical protein VLM75_03865 [Spirochaetota bacterium]|nr:hypothetical protein [Spirochaetota bacterium]